MGQREDNARYEARMRNKDYVRINPRVSRACAQQLQLLAFRHGISTGDLIGRLLAGERFDVEPRVAKIERDSFVHRNRLSESEVLELDRLG